MKSRAMLTLLALLTVLSTSWIPSAQTAAQPSFAPPVIAAEEVAAVARIQARHESQILSIPGVQGFGIGLSADGERAELMVLVSEGSLNPPVASSLDGVPVQVRKVPPVELQDGIPSCTPPCHAEQFPLPVEMGNSAYSTLRCSSCTLGFKACDATRGKFVYVTNAHCTRNSALEQAGLGSATRHVARGDAPGCAFRSIVGEVAGHSDPCDPANTTVDASKIDSDFSLTSSVIRDIGWPFATPGTPALGMLVQKSGRTTGHTFGQITGINVTTQVPAGEYICGAVTMTDQLMIAPVSPSPDWSDEGDSGSAVLDMNGYLVGLNFAGVGTSGLANTIDNVLSELDLTLNLFGCTEDCPFSEAAKGAKGADDLLALGYRFRDEVLPRSKRGRVYAELFDEHAVEVLGIMLTHPSLLLKTRRALERHRETLRWLADIGRARVSTEDLASMKGLLLAFAAEADDDLRKALEGLSKDIFDPAVQADFGIEVR